MAHPFFDAVKYPLHRPEAGALLKTLVDSIRHPSQITLIYEQCGENLPPLTPGQPPNLMWLEVLQNLTVSAALQKLIDQIKQQFPNNTTVQKVISDVVNAQPVVDVVRGPEKPLDTKVDLRAFREAIVKSFSMEDLEILCADLQQSLADEGIDLQVSLDLVEGNGKSAKVQSLIGYFNRRGYLPNLVKAVREARPNISV